MQGVRNFVLSFSLSLVCVSVLGQIYSNSHTKNKKALPKENIQIQLFKNAEAKVLANASLSFANIKKETFTASQQLIASNSNGIDDIEILSINTDDIIPIELGETIHSADNNIDIQTPNEDENIVALLPDNIETQNKETPWVVAKSGNKKIVENHFAENTSIGKAFENPLKDDEFISYKVAERIKQSILFPIPDEILSDENLTPTFIKKDSKESKTSLPAKENTQKVKKIVEQPKVIKTTPKQEAQKTDANKSILTNLSSWFGKDGEKSEKSKKTKKLPSYNSSDNNVTTTNKTENTAHKEDINNKQINNNDFVDFYKTLQETTKEQERNAIMPSELKLSFHPERAEISGQTLRWIKAFSEKTKDENTFIQVRLSSQTPIELQKKRLNLLYTIFMNNNVDPKKIDTVFTTTEPNTFIIRILTIK